MKISSLPIIDAHCHIYPEKIAEKAVAATDNFYNMTSHFNGTKDALIKQGEKCGVVHYIVQSVATTQKQVESINRFIANEVANSNGLFTGLGTLHPDSTDIEGDILLAINLGLKGIKLHPDIQRFALDDEKCLKMYEVCEREHLPILIHTGDYRYDFSNPNRLIPVLKAYKNLTVIGAHLGGWSIWDNASKELYKFDNFYVDCSSSFQFLKPKTAKEIIYRYTPEKVLFGTDFPLGDTRYELDYLLGLNLNVDEYKLILADNAKKVFNIK